MGVAMQEHMLSGLGLLGRTTATGTQLWHPEALSYGQIGREPICTKELLEIHPSGVMAVLICFAYMRSMPVNISGGDGVLPGLFPPSDLTGHLPCGLKPTKVSPCLLVIVLVHGGLLRDNQHYLGKRSPF